MPESSKRRNGDNPRTCRCGRSLLFLIAAAIVVLPGCGRNKFQRELDTETSAVDLARETRNGDYELITTAELKELIDQKTDFVLVDAMPFKGSYKKSHIPGAVNAEFPIAEMSDWEKDKTGGRTRDQYEGLLGEDKDVLVVVYCGFVKCTRSDNAAVWAKKLGYTNVKRHPGGIFAWKGAGFPSESAPK